MSSAGITQETAADFVRRFTEWWQAPDPATMGVLVAPDVVLRQPILADAAGLEAAQRAFARLFAAIPDLTGTVTGWAAEGSRVFIRLTLVGTLGGRPLSWDNVDHFVLRPDGLAQERVNYHDSVAVALRMLGRPRGWATVLRSGILTR